LQKEIEMKVVVMATFEVVKYEIVEGEAVGASGGHEPTSSDQSETRLTGKHFGGTSIHVSD